MNYRISTVSSESPDMSPDQFEKLVEDIREKGVLQPLVVCGDEIIDGRKRYRACERLGIEPPVVNVSKDQDPDALSYSLNVLRTHYSDGQLALMAEQRATELRGKLVPEPTTYKLVRRKAVHESAAEFGIGPTTVTIARRVRREAPELAEYVRAGKLTVNAALRILLAHPDADDRARVAERVIAQSASRGLSRAANNALIPAKPVHRRSPTLALPERMARTLSQLETSSELMGRWLPEAVAAEHPDLDAWVRRVEQARTELTRALNAARKTPRGNGQ